MIFFGARKEAKRTSVSSSRIRHKSFGLSEVENSVAFPCSKQIPLGVPFGREWYGICFFFRCSPECQLLRFQITLICCFAEAKQPAPGLSPRVSVESSTWVQRSAMIQNLYARNNGRAASVRGSVAHVTLSPRAPESRLVRKL